MMTSQRPNVQPGARYSVKEAAAILGIHPNTLHNHTVAGHIRALYSKSNGWPRYEGRELVRFWEETI